MAYKCKICGCRFNGDSCPECFTARDGADELPTKDVNYNEKSGFNSERFYEKTGGYIPQSQSQTIYNGTSNVRRTNTYAGAGTGAPGFQSAVFSAAPTTQTYGRNRNEAKKINGKTVKKIAIIIVVFYVLLNVVSAFAALMNTYSSDESEYGYDGDVLTQDADDLPYTFAYAYVYDDWVSLEYSFDDEDSELTYYSQMSDFLVREFYDSVSFDTVYKNLYNNYQIYLCDLDEDFCAKKHSYYRVNFTLAEVSEMTINEIYVFALSDGETLYYADFFDPLGYSGSKADASLIVCDEADEYEIAVEVEDCDGIEYTYYICLTSGEVGSLAGLYG